MKPLDGVFVADEMPLERFFRCADGAPSFAWGVGGNPGAEVDVALEREPHVGPVNIVPHLVEMDWVENEVGVVLRAAPRAGELCRHFRHSAQSGNRNHQKRKSSG